MATRNITDAQLRTNVLKLLLENAREGLYLCRMSDDTLMRVNPAFCDIVARLGSDFLVDGLPLSAIYDTRDLPIVRQNRQQLTPGASIEFECNVLLPNSQSKRVSIRERVVSYNGEMCAAGSIRELHGKHTVTEDFRVTTAVPARDGNDIRASKRLRYLKNLVIAFSLLGRQLAEQNQSEDLIKQACLFLTDTKLGLHFTSAVIYMMKDSFLKVAYATPFKLTSRISYRDIDEGFKSLLEQRCDVVETEENRRAVPIINKDKVIGILEVGLPESAISLHTEDGSIQEAENAIIRAVADYVGTELAALSQREEVEQQVVEDPMTGLFNRRHFTAKLATEFRRAVRYDRELSLIVLDIDNFKAVNDLHGHPQGDEVIRELGRVLKSSFRETDIVCRIGGEEFAVVMPETASGPANAKAEAIRRAVEAARVPLNWSLVEEARKDELNFTVSVGVASLSSTIESAEHLFQEADRMLFQAKRSGKNRVASL